MLTRHRFGAILLTTALLLISCAGGSSPQASGPYKIGLLFGITGDYAQYGASMRDAALLAFDQLSKRSGAPKFSPVVQDDLSQTTESVTAFNQLIGSGTQIVIGPVASVQALAISPIANSRHVIVMAPVSDSPSYSHTDGYTFRTRLPSTFEGAQLGGYAYNQLHHKRVAVLVSNDQSDRQTVDAMTADFVKSGGKVVGQQLVEQGQSDFRSQLASLASQKPDTLFAYIQDYATTALVFKQARELGMTVPLLAGAPVATPDFIKAAGPLSEGIVYSTESFNTQSTDPAVESFVHLFEARYGRAPVYWDANTWDAINILAKAVAAVGGTDPGKIKDYLRNKLHNYHGVSGTFSFDRNGDPVGKKSAVFQIENGQFVRVG